MQQFSVIGKPLPRIDAKQKATGEAKYLDDIQMPGMLYGKILRSPYPHARILNVDTSEAKKLPGVRAVITAADTPGLKFSFLPGLADKEMLCKDKVRYVGDEVAAVAAVSLEAAEEALKLIKVEYEPIDGVFDPEEAMRPGAPLVHEEKESNIVFELHKSYGDVESVFASTEKNYIFEDRFTTSRVAHCCLETRGCIAYFDRTGKLTVWSPTQTPHILRQELSRILGIGTGNIRVICTLAGGGFGSRLVMDMKEPIAALLSRVTGRPVKIVNSREEEFETSRSRYPYIIYLKTAVSKEGKILARQAKVIVDNGAYNDKGPSTLALASTMFGVLYNVPNLKFDGYVVYTNHQYGTGFRGFGNPQIHFAIESQMDIIAHKLGIDPVDLRLRNANKPGQTTITGARITSCGLEDCIAQATEAIGWQRNRPKPEPEARSKRRGIGVAIMVHTGGGTRTYGYNAVDAFVKVSEDGIVTVVTPAVEIGQGAITAMAQIAAEVLGIPIDRIRVLNENTDMTPYDLGVFASRTVFVCGNAVKAAAEDARREILSLAAEVLNCPETEVRLKDGKVWCQSTGDSVPFEKIAEFGVLRKGRPISGKGRYWDPQAPLLSSAAGSIDPIPTYTFACQAVELEVDLETGQVEVLKVVAAHDTGVTINPLMASGQVEGAVIQGLGYALTEELRTGNGQVLNPNFLDYKVLHAMDVPKVESIMVESNDPYGPFGAKGIGESGLVPIAAAVANAIYDATGIRFRDLPVTPERILAAIKLR